MLDLLQSLEKNQSKILEVLGPLKVGDKTLAEVLPLILGCIPKPTASQPCRQHAHDTVVPLGVPVPATPLEHIMDNIGVASTLTLTREPNDGSGTYVAYVKGPAMQRKTRYVSHTLHGLLAQVQTLFDY